MYDETNLTFNELLIKDGSVSIHHRNLQKLATEMYKVKNNISPIPVTEIFKENNIQYNLRKKRNWECAKTRTVFYGTETIRFQGPKLWDMVPNHIKESETLLIFKAKIKDWKPYECTCRLCKTFIPELGFIN